MQISRFIQTLRETPATSFFLIANIAVYLVLGAIDTRAFTDLAHDSFLIDWGANVPTLVFAGEYWRLLTSMFLHVGIFHIGMNMLGLWALGRILEPKIGATYFSAIYLLSGLAGSLLSAITRNGHLFISCGASGAILGIFGVAIVYAVKNKSRSEIPLSSLVISLVLTFGSGAVSNVDNSAHLGGLLMGILMTMLLVFAYRYKAIKHTFVAAFFVLPAVCIGAGYGHYYDVKMKDQLTLAKLNTVLGNIGLGNTSAVYSGLPAVNDCIDAAANELYNQIDNTQFLIKLKTCNTQTGSEKDFIATAAPRQFANCQALVTDLTKTYNKPAQQQFWSALHQYCQTHSEAFSSVFAKASPLITEGRLAKAYVDSGEQLNKIAHPTTVELTQAHQAFVAIFSKINPMAVIVEGELGCPYTTCKRFN